MFFIREFLIYVYAHTFIFNSVSFKTGRLETTSNYFLQKRQKNIATRMVSFRKKSSYTEMAQVMANSNTVANTRYHSSKTACVSSRSRTATFATLSFKNASTREYSHRQDPMNQQIPRLVPFWTIRSRVSRTAISSSYRSTFDRER